MKNVVIILFVLVLAGNLFAQDSTKITLTRAQYVKSFTVKSDSLNQLALRLATPGASRSDLNQAIEYIMKGLHTYSKFRDSIGLRETFDHLSLVYHLQKKYVQAKWFAIQSNTLAREMRDTVNIIHSLITLSSVKIDIKDYDLAYRDLSEAVYLAKTQPGIQQQVLAEQALADYYNKTGNSHKAGLATNRIKFLNDSVNRITEIKTLNIDHEKQDSTKLAYQLKQRELKKDIANIANDKKGIAVIIGSIIAFTGLLLTLIYQRKKRK